LSCPATKRFPLPHGEKTLKKSSAYSSHGEEESDNGITNFFFKIPLLPSHEGRPNYSSLTRSYLAATQMSPFEERDKQN
jgi:hypothetical protein